MFKTTVSVSHKTDNIDDVINSLLNRASRSGMDSGQSNVLREQFRSQIGPILERGKELYLNGSQMKVDASVKGEGYDILVKASFGIKSSFWKRFLDRD